MMVGIEWVFPILWSWVRADEQDQGGVNVSRPWLRDIPASLPVAAPPADQLGAGTGLVIENVFYDRASEDLAGQALQRALRSAMAHDNLSQSGLQTSPPLARSGVTRIRGTGHLVPRH